MSFGSASGLGSMYLLPKYLVPTYLLPKACFKSTWCQVLRHRVLGTKYSVPSTWYQVLGSKYLVPSAWYLTLSYQVSWTKYLVPRRMSLKLPVVWARMSLDLVQQTRVCHLYMVTFNLAHQGHINIYIYIYLCNIDMFILHMYILPSANCFLRSPLLLDTLSDTTNYCQL